MTGISKSRVVRQKPKSNRAMAINCILFGFKPRCALRTLLPQTTTMGKRATKRQKTERHAVPLEPLGSKNFAKLQDDASKDEEERRLESMLFGTPYIPRQDDGENILIISDDEGDKELDVTGGHELQNLTDTDVRF